MWTKTEINEYLYAEFGLGSDSEADAPDVRDDWPFRLNLVGTIAWPVPGTEVYEFESGGESFYAIAGAAPLNYVLAEGLTMADLALTCRGSAWISRQNPIDLNTSRIGDPTVPPLYQRRQAIALLAARALGRGDGYQVIEGLFLQTSGQYLALIQDEVVGEAMIVGSQIEPRFAPQPRLPAWRRLALAVGQMLQAGLLAEAGRRV